MANRNRVTRGKVIRILCEMYIRRFLCKYVLCVYVVVHSDIVSSFILQSRSIQGKLGAEFHPSPPGLRGVLGNKVNWRVMSHVGRNSSIVCSTEAQPNIPD